jgi:hypothetical protein
MSGGAREGAGRKTIHIDPLEAEKLCAMQCTLEEIADYFGVSVGTIQNRRKQRQFGDAMRRGEAKGRISIRRAQFRLVEAGNVPMTIWMGKVRLGQKDNTACVRLNLPPIENSHDVARAAEEVTQAIAHGQISPEQGETVMRGLDMRSRIIADVETIRRVEKLEEKLAAANPLPRAA